MAIKELEVEIAQAKGVLESENTPVHRHALGLLEARLTGLLVQVSTPQRGTPFVFEQVGKDRNKEVREAIQLGYVTAARVVIPAHDGSVCILPGHAPMVGLLGSGELVVTSRAARIPGPRIVDRTVEIPEGVQHRLFVSGGTFRVKDNRVLVLAARGFVPGQLVIDDLESEETRRKIQSRMAEEALEGETLQAVILEAKRHEVAEHRRETEARDPSLEKEAEIRRIRAMEKLLV